MPSLTKLVALLLFAGLAAVADGRYLALHDDPPRHGSLVLWLTLIGGAVGWRFVGARVGGSLANAAWVGVQGVILIVFWALVLLGTAEVFVRGYRRAYDDVGEAFLGLFDIALEHLARMADPDFALFILGGGVVLALICNLFHRVAERRRFR